MPDYQVRPAILFLAVLVSDRRTGYHRDSRCPTNIQKFYCVDGLFISSMCPASSSHASCLSLASFNRLQLTSLGVRKMFIFHPSRRQVRSDGVSILSVRLHSQQIFCPHSKKRPERNPSAIRHKGWTRIPAELRSVGLFYSFSPLAHSLKN